LARKQLQIAKFCAPVTCELLKLQACAIYRKKQFRNNFYSFSALKQTFSNIRLHCEKIFKCALHRIACEMPALTAE